MDFDFLKAAWQDSSHRLYGYAESRGLSAFNHEEHEGHEKGF